MKSLKPFLEDSVKIDSGFKKKWDIQTRIINLSEEVGELAHDVLVLEGKKNDNLQGLSIGGSLANLLFEIFLIASIYEVDLDQSWDEFLEIMPKWVEKRNK